VVGRCGPVGDREKVHHCLVAAGADYTAATLQETRERLVHVVRQAVLHLASPSPQPGEGDGLAKDPP
jgi:hypothetical protein